MTKTHLYNRFRLRDNYTCHSLTYEGVLDAMQIETLQKSLHILLNWLAMWRAASRSPTQVMTVVQK